MKQAILKLQTGLVSYSAGLEMQSEARARVLAGDYSGALLLLEHHPVITTGRGGGRENLLMSAAQFAAMGVDLFESDRGGNVTCHNPGQLVGYPVLNLSCWREDVHWYVDRLEEVIIRALKHYGLVAGRKSRYTGVWVGNQKVAAIGVSVRRWITGHGFALNINNDLSLFRQIVPCGIHEFGVTSLAAQGVTVTWEEVAAVLGDVFAEVFDVTIQSATEVKIVENKNV